MFRVEDRYDDIKSLFDSIYELLKEKQVGYGNTYEIVPEILKLFLYEKKQGDYYILTGDDISRLLSIVRIIDKLFRIVNGNKGNEDAWEDIIGYCILEKFKNKRGVE